MLLYTSYKRAILAKTVQHSDLGGVIFTHKISLMLILLKICLDKKNVLFFRAFIQRISITICYAWLNFEREHWSQKRNCINSHFAKRKKDKAEGNVSQSTLYYTTMCTSYSNQILYYNIKQLFSSSNFTQ
jgi:hypothetical protein